MSKFSDEANEKMEHGCTHIHCETWLEFNHFLVEELLDRTEFIWRGHKSTSWLLQSTLARAFTKKNIETKSQQLMHY